MAGSVENDTQTPWHSLEPGRHAHAPAMHCRLAPHALSHAPQWAALSPVSTQALPHWAPVAQEQEPLAQVAPAEQVAAQAPQLSESVCKSTQPPAQSIVPRGQVAAH